ncbi:hypothetical protein [Paenibacillus sp. N3.4]|uniref:hypothetical protein n=1 Tax=Paenibacillus sp. N3.4 TaxID=2603222 RepID=UPI0011C73F75|nr:hypothetical protein [Paenibacillus sp. N3.4]TXK85761.1 hypothetical protein FU659_02315 [Paenibacillus sp. N3.4]
MRKINFVLLIVAAISITITGCVSYSDSERQVDIAKLESMKQALDSDMRGIQTFQNDQKEGKPVSSDRYAWYLHIQKEYENGVSSYNEIAKKTGSPRYTPQ